MVHFGEVAVIQRKGLVSDELFLKLQSIVAESPILSPFFERWEDIALPDGWLVAGAIAQTVWNHAFGLPPAHGINDIDIVYLDATDLSEDAEAAHAARLRSIFSDLPVWIDVKNEARVHLWYEAKFGYAIEPYRSVADAITTFPTTATAVGLQRRGDDLALCAPFGLSDLFETIVRPNKKQITSQIYANKVNRWVALWPGLRVIDWGD